MHSTLVGVFFAAAFGAVAWVVGFKFYGAELMSLLFLLAGERRGLGVHVLGFTCGNAVRNALFTPMQALHPKPDPLNKTLNPKQTENPQPVSGAEAALLAVGLSGALRETEGLFDTLLHEPNPKKKQM